MRFRPVLEVIRRRRTRDAAWLDKGKGPWWLEPLAKRLIRKRVREKVWAGPRTKTFRLHRFPAWLVQQRAYWISNVPRQRKAKLGLWRRWRGNARLVRLHRFPAWLVQQGAYWLNSLNRLKRARARKPYTWPGPRIFRRRRFPAWLFQQGAYWLNALNRLKWVRLRKSYSWQGPRVFRRRRFPSWLVQQGAYWLRRKPRRPLPLQSTARHLRRRVAAWITLPAVIAYIPFRRRRRPFPAAQRPRPARLRRYAGWTVQQGAYWVSNVRQRRQQKQRRPTLWAGQRHRNWLRRFPAWLIQQGAYWLRLRRRRPATKLARPRRRHFFPQQPSLAAYIPFRRKRRPAYPAWLGPPPRQRVRHKIVTQWVTLVLAQRAWVWNGQAAALALALGTVAKAWVWNAQSALLSFGQATVSRAWVWAKNTPTLTTPLGLVSKAWRWAGNAPTINLPVASLLQTLIAFCYPGWKRGH